MARISLVIGCLLGLTAFASAAPGYPWDLTGRIVPAYQVLKTDNPSKDEYMVIYTLIVSVDAKSTRDDIKTISEKLIEGLPPHNMAVLFFVGNPSEKDTEKGWTVAKTWWGLNKAALRRNDFHKAGDYSQNEMNIAMKGQDMPGDTVEKY